MVFIISIIILIMQQRIFKYPPKEFKNKILFYMHPHTFTHTSFSYIKKKSNHFSLPYFPSIIEHDNITLQTRAQHKKAMEKFEQNHVALRENMYSVKGDMEEMKDKIDQLTRAITNMTVREARDDRRKVASVSTPPPMEGNPLQGFIPDIKEGEAKNNTLHLERSIPTIVHPFPYNY